MIRELQETDWSSVKSIYIQGIKTNNATFECPSNVPDYQEWRRYKIEDACFVLEKEDTIKGWSALSPVSDRCVYAGVAEVSVYVDLVAQGNGFGHSLLQTLVEYADTHNIWTLQAGIFPENKGSIALHQKVGFREVGYREKIGQLNGKWRDVLLFERRSTIII